MPIRKAIIPAAGLGTRFLPATKAQPKEMLPIIDKPTIQYIVEEAIQSGITEIVIITGRGKSAIIDHFDKSYELEAALEAKGKHDLLKQVEDISKLAEIYMIRQKEAKGLGHAVWCARHFIGQEPFAVLLGDDVVASDKPCLQQMVEMYNKYDSPVLGVQEVPASEVSKYGIIKPGKSWGERIWEVEDLVEKPPLEQAPSNLAIMGRYILTQDIFPIIENLPPGSGGDIQLTDAIRILNKTHRVSALNFTGHRYDVGDKFGYIRATIEFALRREDLRDELIEYLQSLNIDEINVKHITKHRKNIS